MVQKRPHTIFQKNPDLSCDLWNMAEFFGKNCSFCVWHFLFSTAIHFQSIFFITSFPDAIQSYSVCVSFIFLRILFLCFALILIKYRLAFLEHIVFQVKNWPVKYGGIFRLKLLLLCLAFSVFCRHSFSICFFHNFISWCHSTLQRLFFIHIFDNFVLTLCFDFDQVQVTFFRTYFSSQKLTCEINRNFLMPFKKSQSLHNLCCKYFIIITRRLKVRCFKNKKKEAT